MIRQTFAAARTALGWAGLRFRGAGSVNTSNRALNWKVASQSPRPGTSVPRGPVVALRVFRFGSAQRVRVPSVVR
ncbi:MAG: PASTA domain-containing protein [Nitrospinota bacterium]